MKPKGEGGLGFRDIHIFNLIMLAKQGWRLQQQPGSLYAQVLKAKYFASCSVLEAKPKAGMSYTWRKLRGIELINKEMIWRIGYGVDLNIWFDPWLPREFSRRPITSRGAVLLTEVVDLFVAPQC